MKIVPPVLGRSLIPVALAAVALAVAWLALRPLAIPYIEAYQSAASHEEAALPAYDPGDSRVQTYLRALAEKAAGGPSAAELPAEGDEFARIRIADAAIDAPIFFGDTPELLEAGVGTWTGGGVPGQGRTILMGGHNNTDFLTLTQVKGGELIEIETDYGTFLYEVVDAKELMYDDQTVLDLLGAGYENLILYTCTRSIPGGDTPWRWFVYGKPVGN